MIWVFEDVSGAEPEGAALGSIQVCLLCSHVGAPCDPRALYMILWGYFFDLLEGVLPRLGPGCKSQGAGTQEIQRGNTMGGGNGRCDPLLRDWQLVVRVVNCQLSKQWFIVHS